MKITRRDGLWVGAGAITAAGAGFAFNWIVARGLGPGGTGVVLSFATWFTILLTLGKIGTDTAVMREGARTVAGATPISAARYVFLALRIVMPLSVVMAIALWVAAPYVTDLLASDSGSDPVAIIRLGAVLLPFAIVGFILLAALRGRGQVGPFVSIEQILKPAARVISALVVFVLGVASAFAYSAAWALPTIIGFAATLYLVARSRKQWKVRDASDRTERRDANRDLWKFAMPRAVAQGVDILNASVGVVLLAAMSGATATGLFGTALRIVLAGQLSYHAVRLLIAPVIAHRLARDDIPSTQAVYTSSNSLVVVLSWPLYFLILGAAEPVLRLFGSGFTEAAWILRVLVFVAIAVALLGNMQTVVLMSGRSRPALGATTIGLMSTTVVTLALVPVWGGMGAALGWGAGVLAEATLLALIMLRMGLRPAAGPTLNLAGRTLLVLGAGSAVFELSGHHYLIGALAYLAALMIWAWWCRQQVMAAWRALSTGHGADERTPGTDDDRGIGHPGESTQNSGVTL